MKPFGSDVKNKMHFQGRPQKYKNMFHFEANPGVGPGTTEYMKPFGSNIQHKVFFAGKPKTKKQEVTPSPGEYMPQSSITKPRIPSVSIGKQKKFSNSRSAWLESPMKDNPDPGVYNIDRSMYLTKPKPPGFRIK